MEGEKDSSTNLTLGDVRGETNTLTALEGKRPVTQAVAMAIKLLMGFLKRYMDRCGEVIEIRNIGEFCSYITKDCYPKGLNRESYIESIAIHRMLDREGEDGDTEPRRLKTYFIY